MNQYESINPPHRGGDVLGIHVHSCGQVLGGDELLLVDEEVYQGHLRAPPAEGGGGAGQEVA
jgi:hypothetical protein